MMDTASNLVFELFFIRAVLNPFLFIIVLEALSRQFRKFVHGSCSMQIHRGTSGKVEDIEI